MTQNIDMLVMGGCLGMGLGFAIGYGTRALRGLVQRHHQEVREINTPVRLAQPAFVSLPEHKQEQRLRVVKSAPDGHHPDRSVVLDALTSAGYKKTQATNAVDACTGPEKATVESWTVAALRRATGR